MFGRLHDKLTTLRTTHSPSCPLFLLRGVIGGFERAEAVVGPFAILTGDVLARPRMTRTGLSKVLDKASLRPQSIDQELERLRRRDACVRSDAPQLCLI